MNILGRPWGEAEAASCRYALGNSEGDGPHASDTSTRASHTEAMRHQDF